MIDEKTIVMGSGYNRTYQNLLENPKAVFLVMEPGKTVPGWRGAIREIKLLMEWE